MRPRALTRGLRSVGNVVAKVSSLPSYESYSWGSKRSWTAWCLYHSIFGLRLASPLQWWKYYKRKLYKPLLHSTLENKARPDFHAADSERYLFIVLIASISLWAAGGSIANAALTLLPDHIWLLSWLGWSVVLAFLIESIQWTFYYALFRPLVERAKLNLYDEAEYLIMLPVVILTQVALLAILWGKGLEQTGLLLLNVSDPLPVATEGMKGIPTFPMSSRSQALFAVLLGQSYIVVIIASLIRVVPALHVRKRPNITVIGYGDVVRHRILPALLAVYHPRQLAVASDVLSAADRRELKAMNIHSLFSACTGATERASGKVDVIGKIAEWSDAHSKFAIVAVPTPSHLEYALQLSNRGIRIALEKPIVGSAPELGLLCERSSGQLFADIFVFSYYWLEKGLSLNYLLTLNPVYRSLLDYEPEMSMQDSSWQLAQLGKLKSLTVEFLEGEETLERYWTELRANGGMVMETMVHPLTFVVNLARYAKVFTSGKPLWATPPQIEWRRNAERTAKIRELHNKDIGPTFAQLHGKLSGDIAIHVRCGKYLAEKGSESRRLIAIFENGMITTDLSEMVTRLFLNSGTEQMLVLSISNKKLLKSQKMRRGETDTSLKYQYQVEMLNTFFVDGWSGLRFDDYPSQLDVLHELTEIERSLPGTASIQNDKDAVQVRWITQDMMTNPNLFKEDRLNG